MGSSFNELAGRLCSLLFVLWHLNKLPCWMKGPSVQLSISRCGHPKVPKWNRLETQHFKACFNLWEWWHYHKSLMFLEDHSLWHNILWMGVLFFGFIWWSECYFIKVSAMINLKSQNYRFGRGCLTNKSKPKQCRNPNNSISHWWLLIYVKHPIKGSPASFFWGGGLSTLEFSINHFSPWYLKRICLPGN